MGAMVGTGFVVENKGIGYSYDPTPIFGNVRTQVNKTFGGRSNFPGWFVNEHPLTTILDYFTWNQFNQQERRGLVSAVHAGEFSGEKYMKQIVGGIQDTYKFLEKYKVSENPSTGTFNVAIPMEEVPIMQINWRSPGIAGSVSPATTIEFPQTYAKQYSRIDNNSWGGSPVVGQILPRDVITLSGIRSSPSDWAQLSESLFGGDNILSSHRTQWLNLLSQYGLYQGRVEITTPQNRQDARKEIATAKDIARRRQQYRKWVEGGADRRAARAGASGGRGAGAVGGGAGVSGTDTSLTLNRPSLLGF